MANMKDLEARIEALEATIVELRASRVGGADDPSDAGWVGAVEERLGALELKVHATNKSAPINKNMTDADAVRVLTGDLKDVPHKEAAGQAGLTYAQVYSCRLEYTFKHVHKELRDGGWKNQHVKR